MPILREVLRLEPGEMVAFVGAGGKTTTLQRLVVELLGAGRTVLTTSTVHLFELKGVPPHPFVVEPDPARLLADLPALLRENRHVRVAGERIRNDKIRGLEPEQIAALRTLPGLDHVLVEADGSRHRSLKAPGPHEPRLPTRADVVLLVVGLDILGQPLDEAHVHRPEQVALLTGLASGAAITAEAVAAVLSDNTGGLKDVEPGSRCWVIGTKYSEETAAGAGAIAAALREAGKGRLAGIIFLGGGPVGVIGSAPLIVNRF